MAYHIASDDRIIQAIRRVFKKYRQVSSQTRLKTLVEKELQTKKKNFQVTGARLRLLIFLHRLADVEIHTREGDPRKILTRCPVCTGSLTRVKNQTIWGGEVTLEFRCKNCGYWTGKKKRIPTRYVFHKNTSK
ncbi:MAG: hypothetical protein KKC68_00215 [Candidatus Thermoplasmatota archaeon]|nr:hypothetical protein [Candidatus Thermoplasmatota archaeon]MBU1940175.1 hypothetical protein [Candidatus Thermoplasmatota archaeon]